MVSTKYILDNKADLLDQKTGTIKHADFITSLPIFKSNRDEVLERRVIINTTNIIDSHLDLHIPGIWDETLSKRPRLLYLQEHQREFKKIISDGKDLEAFTKEFTWKELGFNYEGNTEALTFDVKIRQDRNSFMFTQFKHGLVKQNSVGMRYKKVLLAVNDPDHEEEYENWKKYAPMVANKSILDEISFFFPVLEAEILEGSAVPLGSNSYTPVLNRDKEAPNTIDYKWLLEHFKKSKITVNNN